jgi:hypothetical protein
MEFVCFDCLNQFGTLATNWLVAPVPNGRCVWSNGGMRMGKGNGSIWGKCAPLFL